MAQLGRNARQIASNVRRFQRGANGNHARARDLLRRTAYCVMLNDGSAFGPSKFCAYASLSLSEYFDRRLGEMHGSEAQKHIGKVLSLEFQKGARFREKLRRWSDSLLGPGTFDGIDSGKWRFVTLPRM